MHEMYGELQDWTTHVLKSRYGHGFNFLGIICKEKRFDGKNPFRGRQ